MEMTRKENRVWDYTTLSTFLECRRKYYWRMVKHYTPKTPSAALLFGLAIHSALDAYYTVGLEEAIKVFQRDYQDREGDDRRTVENGVKLLEWYAKIYQHEPFKVIGKPEVGFVFPLGNLLYGGRIDLPVEWSPGFWIVEHKTTTILGANYFKQFELDIQITGYILAFEAYTGKKCEGCMVNALEPWKELKKPTARSKTPEQHFARAPLTRSKKDKERFKLNVQRIVRDILWCEENNEFYETETREHCWSFNSECPFKTLCLYGEDPRFIEKDYAVEPWEPYKQALEQKGGEKDGEAEKGKSI